MYSPEFKEKLKSLVRHAENSGQSEGLALSCWLQEMLDDEEGMEDEVVLGGLSELAKWVQVAHEQLGGKGPLL